MLNDILYFHFSTVTTSSSSALWFRQHLVHYWKVQNISTDCFPVSMIKVFTSGFLARGNSIVFQHFFFIIILKLFSLYYSLVCLPAFSGAYPKLVGRSAIRSWTFIHLGPLLPQSVFRVDAIGFYFEFYLQVWIFEFYNTHFVGIWLFF